VTDRHGSNYPVRQLFAKLASWWGFAETESPAEMSTSFMGRRSGPPEGGTTSELLLRWELLAEFGGGYFAFGGGKIVAQSVFMLTTVHFLTVASSRRPTWDWRS
jgi:hypothetical protein